MSTPNQYDFFGETPPERIIGTESECNLQFAPGHTQMKYISPEAIAAAGYRSINGFIDNGTRVYVDMQHLEVDTAEALGPRQAAAADLASVLMLRQIVEASGLPHNGVHRYTGTNIGGREHTSGYHENYIFPRILKDSVLFDTIMASHLASRTWAMSGALNSSLLLSQKAKGIGGSPITRNLERRTEHGSKPMAMIPPLSIDKATTGDAQWARLEVRYADAGFSLTARYLAFAATSLTLRLIEHQVTGEHIDKLVSLSFRNNVAAANAFNHDLSFNETMETHGGADISAVDYQEFLADAAHNLSERVELPEDELAAIELWHDVCDRLRAVNSDSGDFKDLLTTLEFAPRFRFLLRKFNIEDINSDNPEAVEASLTWDRLMPTGGGLKFWSATPSPYVPREEVERLLVEPPATRAAVRGRLIHRAAHEDAVGAGWANVRCNGKDTPLTDPYSTV